MTVKWNPLPGSWAGACIAGGFAAGPTLAAPSPEGLTAPVVTVTAARRADLGADELANPYRVAPSSRAATQTFTAEDVAALRPRNVFELLDHAVGVLTLSQGRKIPYSVRIRGDVNFAFIVDGVYLPQTSAGRVLQSLPVSMIEQVDVVRDATALSLAPLVNFVSPAGSPNDGFIVIRTRRPARTELQWRASAERFDTVATSAYAGVATQPLYVAGFASGFDGNGRPGETMARTSGTGMAKVGLRGGPLQFDFSWYQDQTEQQIQAADPLRSALGPQRWALDPVDTGFGSAGFTAAWSDAQVTTLQWARSRVTATQLQGSISGMTPNVIPNAETLESLDLKHSLRFGATLLRVGAQRLHWNTPTGQAFYEGSPREERISGWFAQAERSWFAGALSFDAAVREDDHTIVLGVDRYTATPVRGTLASFRDRALPASRYFAAGAVWRPRTGLELSLRAYRARQGGIGSVPTVNDRTLDPERQTKFEAGIAWAGTEAFSPALTVFRSRIDNAKQPVRYVRSGLVFIALFDQADVMRSGIEGMVRGRFETSAGTTRYRAGWTWLTQADGAVDYGRTAPRHVGTLSLQHARGDWDANFALNRVSTFHSDWQAVDGLSHPIGDYTRIDVSIGRQWLWQDQRWYVTLYARNLGDVRYETQLGFRDPGRVWGVEALLEL